MTSWPLALSLIGGSIRRDWLCDTDARIGKRLSARSDAESNCASEAQKTCSRSGKGWENIRRSDMRKTTDSLLGEQPPP